MGAGYLFSWGLWEYLKHLPADEELLLSVTLQRGGTYLVSEAALSCTTHSYNNAERDLHTCLYHTFTHRTYNLIFMSSWGFSTDSRLSSRQDGATLCLPLENTKLKNIYILDINGCESSSELIYMRIICRTFCIFASVGGDPLNTEAHKCRGASPSWQGAARERDTVV